MAHLSQRKIAARLGCSHTYIQKLLARGVITHGAMNDKGRIDPAVALQEILACVDDSVSCITGPAAEWLAELTGEAVKSATKKAAVKKPVASKQVEKQEAKKPGAENRHSPKADEGKTAPSPRPPSEVSAQESITDANRRDAIAKADMREMARAREKKLLVNAREVEIEAFTRARQLRDAILSISDRIAPIIAAETDEHTVRQILDAEHRSILKSLAETETACG